MTGASSEVLKEYLIRLGFQTDNISLSKFTNGLGSVGTRMLKIGTAVTAVVGAVEAATAAFAYSMRKVYFTSELSQSSVKNIKALSYASKQFGIDGDAMTGVVKNMAQLVRLNPGLKGLAESLGVKVTGRDMSDVALDLVGALRKMPEFVGAQFAQMFGIDPENYHLLVSHLDEIKKKKQEALEFGKQAGYDPDLQKNKDTILEYTAAIDGLKMKLSILSQSLLVKFAPSFRAFNETISDSLGWWIKWSAGLEKMPSGPKNFAEFLKTSKNVVSWVESWFGGSKVGGNKTLPGAAPRAVPSAQASGKISIASAGGKKEPKGAYEILRSQGWSDIHASGIVANLQAESAMNHRAVGDGGKAYGLAQWHPNRQADFKKLHGKDIRESTEAEQLNFLTYELRAGNEQAAGKKLLAAKTKSEAGQAVSRYYERPADAEGQAELRGRLATKLGSSGAGNSVNVVQNNVINVNGQNASAVASAISKEQTRTMGDALRTTKTAHL